MIGRRRAFVIAFALSSVGLSSCSDSDPEFGCERPRDGALLCVYAGDDSAEGRLLTPEDDRTAALGSYCWETQPGLTECADFGDIPKLEQPLILQNGSTIAMVSDADRLSVGIGTVKVEGAVRGVERIDELDFTNGSAAVDVAPGRYILDAFGRWGSQDAELYFAIEVR